jgi:chromosome segregation ATPase
MQLSSITIRGFKSFPERTRLVFARGVSVIVGPNGSGKSNITDAVLWALGEQSPLSVRGQSMRDMIFAGGAGRGPSRYAEVEVVLSADEHEISTSPAGAESGAEAEGPSRRRGQGVPAEDEQPAGSYFAEFAIRRRLDRDGEGGYWLNGARCRHLDVIEALADANLGREMHSVISQGRVEEIVHSRPRERRLLVEEAAGLGKHRKRRRRAQLKLERTQENLDRAVDVEREARSRLRPLKRQAQAADIHTRLEREAAELRALLLASELRLHADGAGGAEAAAERARAARDSLEAKLAEVNRRRTAIEERLAARDRERTEAWGRLTAIRAAYERLAARAEALAARRAELAADLERRRTALGALADRAGADDDAIAAGLEALGRSVAAAGEALAAAEAADDACRAEAIAAVREAAERSARTARRLEELLASRLQGTLEGSLEAAEAAVFELDALVEATVVARAASGERARAIERRMLADGDGDGDGVAANLRSCSREEAELQARLRAAGEAVTEAEVRAAQERERREEARAELARIAALLGRELTPPDAPLDDAEREEIEAGLVRVARRREALGPVNPLAEREYEEAQEHVRELAEQREDLETALAELEGLIAETDRKIDEAFAETFEAAQRNFSELVEHLFPGGRGRLRPVSERAPRLVLGGIEADPAGAESGAEEESPSRRRGQGVPAQRSGAEAPEREHPAGEIPVSEGIEIEVTPEGKATRRLSLLSGGEKALVALAFVFAVFLARPSPFYILDEVEAALDDANIDRFLQLVRRFSDRAQFVIVTHQKRTMDAADVLYGVSMGADGVTAVVSRRLPPREDEPAREAAAA